MTSTCLYIIGTPCTHVRWRAEQVLILELVIPKQAQSLCIRDAVFVSVSSLPERKSAHGVSWYVSVEREQSFGFHVSDNVQLYWWKQCWPWTHGHWYCLWTDHWGLDTLQNTVNLLLHTRLKMFPWLQKSPRYASPSKAPEQVFLPLQGNFLLLQSHWLRITMSA